MKHSITALILLTLLCSVAAFSQWQFMRAFADTNVLKGSSGCHGLAVDPDGKVWVQLYAVSDSIKDATSGLFRKCRRIFCYQPDGTPASFNFQKTITVGGVTDTIYSSNVGLRTDINGNILFATFNTLYRLNYKTAAGMNKAVIYPNATIIAPGVDQAGEIFVGAVIPPQPVVILNPDFTSAGNAIDTSQGFARSMNVSADGNDVYWTAFSNLALYRYHSDFGSLGPYLFKDTLFQGMSIESSCWNPKSKLLYLSSGGQSPSSPPYANLRWYGWNPATNKIVDTIVWNLNVSPSVGANDARPRAIAFSPGGDTAYVGQFNGIGPAVLMYKRGPSSVRPEPNVIPTSFTLSQNYPNPFNPTTDIKFTIDRGGLTTLIVYDLLGRQVATLVNEDLVPGAYTTSFDASKLSSGTYVYRLTSGGNSIVKKMLLMK